MTRCKRCDLKTVLSDGEIQEMVKTVTNMRGVRLADEGRYMARFSVCEMCESFMYGSTCAVCGCVMQVRARLSDGKCPRKKWDC